MPERKVEVVTLTVAEHERRIEQRRLDLIAAYHDGLREGVRRYAWWKDGTQYVGSGVYSLADALRTIERDQERAKSG